MNKINVAFIGGLTNGKIVYDYLKSNKYVDLKIVITYPEEINKPRFVEFPNEDFIIKTLDANAQYAILNEAQLDFIFVAGWSQLLDNRLLKLPKKGTIGFHPAKLPENKGRSVIAWQIEEGAKEIFLTMFYYNDFPDGGDIIAAEKIIIENNDYISDVLDKLDLATYNLIYAYFPLLRKGMAPRLKQGNNLGTFRRLRKEKDSWIDWNQNSRNIYNKIRSISKPYPGAIGIIDGIRYKIWRSKLINFTFGRDEEPGTLIAKMFNGDFVVKTKDSFILITEYEQV